MDKCELEKLYERFLENYRKPKSCGQELCSDSDDCQVCKNLYRDCEIFFKEGVKIGLRLGFECWEQ